MKAGFVGAVDATLDAVDVTDADTVRQIAAAFGVTVDPFRSPELHRGGAAVGGVSLLYPRNDVRKEGLSSLRIDVTPSYDGQGWLEFHKGKNVLVRQRFEPDTLSTTMPMPASVVRALKTGETVTWGIYFEDGRKPVTTQFEVVSKPAAAKKLAELAADKRLARQPSILRLQLEAEALQNYRLYSEALTKLLEGRSADKDSSLPYNGIVSCLRRLDLEDTALYSESAARVTKQISGLRAGASVASVPTARPAVTKPGAMSAPTAAAPARKITTPSATPNPTPPAGPTEPSDTNPVPVADGGSPANRPTVNGASLLRGEADRLTAQAAEQATFAQQAADAAAAAAAAVAVAQQAADAARQAELSVSGEVPTGTPEQTAAADLALRDATEAALNAARRAQEAQAAAQRTADAAAVATHNANAAERDAALPSTAPVGSNPSTSPAVVPVPTPVVPATPPSQVEFRAAFDAATLAASTARDAARDAANALVTAEADAQASPDDVAKRASADAARLAADLALQRATDAQRALDQLTRPGSR